MWLRWWESSNPNSWSIDAQELATSIHLQIIPCTSALEFAPMAKNPSRAESDPNSSDSSQPVQRRSKTLGYLNLSAPMVAEALEDMSLAYEPQAFEFR